MEGHILTASKKHDLEKQTKEALKEGWQLDGILSTIEIPGKKRSSTVYYQEIKK